MTITPEQLQAYAEGRAELTSILEMDPVVLEQLRGRAQFFLENDHKERALIMLEMLEELDRTDPGPPLAAVDLLLEQGHSDQAMAKVQRLLDREPGQAEVQVAKAQVLIQTGDLSEAAELLARVIEGDPGGDTPAGARARAVAAQTHARLSGD